MLKYVPFGDILVKDGHRTCMQQVPTCTLIRPYKNIRELLVMQDGIIYKGDQIL